LLAVIIVTEDKLVVVRRAAETTVRPVLGSVTGSDPDWWMLVFEAFFKCQVALAGGNASLFEGHPLKSATPPWNIQGTGDPVAAIEGRPIDCPIGSENGIAVAGGLSLGRRRRMVGDGRVDGLP